MSEPKNRSDLSISIQKMINYITMGMPSEVELKTKLFEYSIKLNNEPLPSKAEQGFLIKLINYFPNLIGMPLPGTKEETNEERLEKLLKEYEVLRKEFINAKEKHLQNPVELTEKEKSITHVQRSRRELLNGTTRMLRFATEEMPSEKELLNKLNNYEARLIRMLPSAKADEKLSPKINLEFDELEKEFSKARERLFKKPVGYTEKKRDEIPEKTDAENTNVDKTKRPT